MVCSGSHPEATFPLPSPVCLSIFHRAVHVLLIKPEEELIDGKGKKKKDWVKNEGDLKLALRTN